MSIPDNKLENESDDIKKAESSASVKVLKPSLKGPRSRNRDRSTNKSKTSREKSVRFSAGAPLTKSSEVINQNNKPKKSVRVPNSDKQNRTIPQFASHHPDATNERYNIKAAPINNARSRKRSILDFLPFQESLASETVTKSHFESTESNNNIEAKRNPVIEHSTLQSSFASETIDTHEETRQPNDGTRTRRRGSLLSYLPSQVASSPSDCQQRRFSLDSCFTFFQGGEVPKKENPYFESTESNDDIEAKRNLVIEHSTLQSSFASETIDTHEETSQPNDGTQTRRGSLLSYLPSQVASRPSDCQQRRFSLDSCFTFFQEEDVPKKENPYFESTESNDDIEAKRNSVIEHSTLQSSFASETIDTHEETRQPNDDTRTRRRGSLLSYLPSQVASRPSDCQQRRSSADSYFTFYKGKEALRKEKQLAREEALKELTKNEFQWNQIRNLLLSNGICTNMAAQEILNVALKDLNVDGSTKIEVDTSKENDDSSKISHTSKSIENTNTTTRASRRPSILNYAVDAIKEGLADEKVEEQPKKERAIYLKSVRHLKIKYH